MDASVIQGVRFLALNFSLGNFICLFAVTGLSLVVSIVVTALVCIFYTTIGGMKAVVWNDVVQVRIS